MTKEFNPAWLSDKVIVDFFNNLKGHELSSEVQGILEWYKNKGFLTVAKRQVLDFLYKEVN